MEISAGVIVRDERGEEPVYLCVRAYSNWDFPKGHVEGDETLLQAAMRELEEETSLNFRDVQITGAMAPPVLYKNKKKTAHYFLADRVGDKDPFLPVNPELGHPENDEWRWMTIDSMVSVFPSRLQNVLSWLSTA